MKTNEILSAAILLNTTQYNPRQLSLHWFLENIPTKMYENVHDKNWSTLTRSKPEANSVRARPESISLPCKLFKLLFFYFTRLDCTVLW